MATACLTAFVFVGGWLVPIDPSFFQSSTNVLMLLLTTDLLDPFLSGMFDLPGEERPLNDRCRVPTHLIASASVVNRGAKLSAECLVLGLEPGEGVLKMLRIKIRPIFIPDVEICVNRLHRKKTAQSAASSPAHNQIQTGNFF